MVQIDHANRAGYTPLLCASRRGNMHVALLLVAAGARYPAADRDVNLLYVASLRAHRTDLLAAHSQVRTTWHRPHSTTRAVRRAFAQHVT